jgi:sec-independent protein translocase protein TatA
MGIGSIGFSELAVIFIIVLVFFGPRRFPEIARSMGHAMREFRRSLNQIQRELEDADPRSAIPGRDLLKDIRSGRTGRWLDPNRANEVRKPSGSESDAPVGAEDERGAEPRPTGGAPGEGPGNAHGTGPSDGAEQLPMFGEKTPPPSAPSEDRGTDPSEGADPESPRDRPPD